MSESHSELWNLGLHSIESLETDQGILASARTEVYGCIFGRDSLITALKLLKTYEKVRSPYFLSLVKKILTNLGTLQGTRYTIESGEEPGKIIHEYRPTGHERLTKHLSNPWYVYPDNVMRNYDSVDATPLYLMAVQEYYRHSQDEAFMQQERAHSTAALAWLRDAIHANPHGFLTYAFEPARRYGGLKTQSWMDSEESVFFEKGDGVPMYPIAPVEAQAYAYAALRAWSHYYKEQDKTLCQQLTSEADTLKQRFNTSFVLTGRRTSLAFALDGNGRPLTSARSSMGHCLFAAWKDEFSIPDSIIESAYIPLIVERLLSPDLYVRNAGIRTLSSRSTHFDPNSYHNGSIWPHDTTIAAHGLSNFGYADESRMVRRSILKAYAYFETPIELFTYAQRKFGEYKDPNGHGACRTQAWSAAALLSMLGGEE